MNLTELQLWFYDPRHKKGIPLNLVLILLVFLSQQNKTSAWKICNESSGAYRTHILCGQKAAYLRILYFSSWDWCWEWKRFGSYLFGVETFVGSYPVERNIGSKIWFASAVRSMSRDLLCLQMDRMQRIFIAYSSNEHLFFGSWCNKYFCFPIFELMQPWNVDKYQLFRCRSVILTMEQKQS